MENKIHNAIIASKKALLLGVAFWVSFILWLVFYFVSSQILITEGTLGGLYYFSIFMIIIIITFAILTFIFNVLVIIKVFQISEHETNRALENMLKTPKILSILSIFFGLILMAFNYYSLKKVLHECENNRFHLDNDHDETIEKSNKNNIKEDIKTLNELNDLYMKNAINRDEFEKLKSKITDRL